MQQAHLISLLLEESCYLIDPRELLNPSTGLVLSTQRLEANLSGLRSRVRCEHRFSPAGLERKLERLLGTGVALLSESAVLCLVIQNMRLGRQNAMTAPSLLYFRPNGKIRNLNSEMRCARAVYARR
jgi:hypothetical protein